MKPKLLYVLESCGIGGVEEVITKLSIYLSSEFDITVMTFDENITENKLKLKKIGIEIVSTFSKYRWNILNVIHYVYYIKTHKINIVHSNHLFPQFLIAIASLFVNNVIFITSEHGVWNKKRFCGIIRYLDRFVYSRYKYVISVSQSVETALLSWLKKDKDSRYIIIHNGVDLDYIEKIAPLQRNLLGFSDEDIVISSIGRMVYGKDFCTIISAIYELPPNYKAIFIGDGPDFNSHKSMVDKLGLQNRVIFTGFQEKVIPFLKMSNIYVASSYFEGFGLTVLEAMACKLPVLATDIAAFEEVIGDEKRLFKIGDVKTLTKLILKQSMGKLTIDYNRINDFSIDKMFLKYKSLYKSVLSEFHQ